MKASVRIGIPFVLILLGLPGFCTSERFLSWCPAKLGPGSHIFWDFKFDISDSVYEHCEFPSEGEKIQELQVCRMVSYRNKERCRKRCR
jgi:hypothetical protein